MRMRCLSVRVALSGRATQPLAVNDYFSGYCHEADMYLPIRAKYCKKHGRVVAKFDHYCCTRHAGVGSFTIGSLTAIRLACKRARCDLLTMGHATTRALDVPMFC